MTTEKSKDFIRQMVEADLASGKHKSVATRFPPEPNGYLHIGHAKNIAINYGIARDYKGTCNLRFDDTNPEKEEQEYVDAIIEDCRWLGFDPGERIHYASDYYGKTYEYAVELVKKGLAYVDDLTAEQVRQYRGTLTEPGKDSPHRDRSVEENLDLFARMKQGEFKDGKRILRAKIDMTHANMNMRDPAIYRIKHASHPRTGDEWCIYPMYDFAHPVEDAIEGITHSLCSLEFEDHRPLYDWVLDHVSVDCRPRQIESARLALTYTILSKRKLIKLVQEGRVTGWDDPRMPTLSGLRRRGYTPEAIWDFLERIGVAKANSLVDVAMLEHSLREDLNKRSPRVMGVLRPLKVVIENYAEGKTEELACENNPEDVSAGTRKVPFSGEVYIEQDDFREEPPPKYFRLSPGKEVRLKHAYYITCKEVKKDAKGEVSELVCTYDPESKGGETPDGRRVKGTLHWVSVEHALDAEVRLYDRLFSKENPDNAPEGKDYLANLNADSIEKLTACKLEPNLKQAKVGERFQFLRHGYFCVDEDSKGDRLVFNRTVSLRDSWAKIEKKGK